jgi:hypothetical protein
VGALAGPVVAEPGSGGDEVPPLRREVLHLQQRRRDEERRVRVQRRRNRHGAHSSTLSFPDDYYSRSEPEWLQQIRSRDSGRPSQSKTSPSPLDFGSRQRKNQKESPRGPVVVWWMEGFDHQGKEKPQI